MINIKLILKGTKGNLIILGDSFEEVEKEYQKNQKKIENLIGECKKTMVLKKPLKNTKEKPTASSNTIQDRILELVNEGFFDSPRTATEVKEALKNKTYVYSFDHVRIALIRTVRKRSLRRLIENRDGKSIYVYTNP
jgi:hypothetical protein